MGNIFCPKTKEQYKVLVDYEGGGEDDEMEIKKGDKLHVLQKKESGWWLCRNILTNQIGYVPYNFIIIDNSQMESQDWWIDCSRGEASSMLSAPSNPFGTFLVRKSKVPGSLVLSVKNTSTQERCVKHYMIHISAIEEFYIYSRVRFKSVSDLVKYYKITKLCCLLTQPCPREAEVLPLRDLEIPRSKIKLIDRLGAGSFGEVWKGKYNQHTVAIKTIKEDGPSLQEDLRTEGKNINSMRHKRLASLIGLCLMEHPYMLIIEYMDRGALDGVLRKDKGKKIRFKQLMEIAAQIVEGMEFIEYKGFIHRDLRTANVLFNSNDLIKISDFGLSKLQEIYINKDAYYPARWNPLEVFERSEFSIKSDVWSFGMLLFELVTYGEKPYDREEEIQGKGIDLLKEIPRFIRKGKRPQNPSIFHPHGFIKFLCPESLYETMNECWHKRADKRPSFKQLSNFFENYEDD